MHKTKKRTLNNREGSNASLMRCSIEPVLMFQKAMRSQDWRLAESLILSAELQIQNDFLCKVMEFIWFLNSRHELYEIISLIKMIVSNGAHNFTKALVKSSFLAACLSVASGSLTMSLESSHPIILQSLNDHIQKSGGGQFFEVGFSVKKLNNWIMTCIENHSELFEKKGNGHIITINDVRLQILGFKAFLIIADDNLSRSDFLEAFEAACFPLIHIQNFYPGWEFGGGAYLLAQQKNLAVDVELALQCASQFGKIRTMECLVVEGQATGFLKPLMAAAKQGCMPVVQWFVNRGCRNVHLVGALVVAASSNKVEIAAYLLQHIPLPFLTSKRVKIIRITYTLGFSSLQGVSLLLQLNFLGDSAATYAAADKIARSDAENVDHQLKVFLQEHWSEAAFLEGMMAGKNHYVNLMRMLKRGESSFCFRDLPSPLLMAIGYMTLYKKCVEANGRLLPQRLRGQLVEIAERITNGAVNRKSQLNELLAVLEHHLPPFVRSS